MELGKEGTRRKAEVRLTNPQVSSELIKRIKTSMQTHDREGGNKGKVVIPASLESWKTTTVNRTALLQKNCGMDQNGKGSQWKPATTLRGRRDGKRGQRCTSGSFFLESV